jgi:MFS family permease
VEGIERRRANAGELQTRTGLLDKRRMIAGPRFNRWLVPPAALAIHLSIGMAYGFSVFWLPLSTALPGVPSCGATTSWVGELTAQCNWRIASLNITFMLFTVMLGVAAALWGNWVERAGPRKAAVVSALCWCSGLCLGALAIHIHQLWLLWLGTGVLGGIGLGLGYISPISILIRWFPDRRGMATGMAVMGFGGGAMVGAPLAVMLMRHYQTADDPGVAATLLSLALIYAVFMLSGAFGYRLPRRGWQPRNWVPPTDGLDHTSRSVHVSQAWKTPSFWCVWGALCMIVSAGLGILSMATPMLQEIFGGQLIGISRSLDELDVDHRAQVALVAVGFTGLLSLFNIAGRLFWAMLSDRIGRKGTYYCFFLLGIPLYALMPILGQSGHVAVFVLGLCILLSMFGGAFAALPAYISDLFGPEMVGAIQGRMLTAWSTAGVIGSILMSALRNEQLAQGVSQSRAYDLTFYVLAGLLVVGLVCNAWVRPVAPRYFMTPAEMEKYQCEMRHQLTSTPKSTTYPEIRITLTATAAVWLPVCLPLAWGVWITLRRVAVLL